MDRLSPHAGVDPAVGYVGEEIDEDVGEADGQETALDEGVVAVGDGADGETAEAGPTEDGFRDDGSGEERAELKADDGDDGDQGVGQGVAADDGELGEALGAGGANVVLA